jgi:deazaflavin-dependent oxidoreductase (nitroreductase family)
MFRHLPRFLWKLMHLGPLQAYRRGQGARFGNRVLVLTTTGRKSGLPRQTPLQYEDIDGTISIGSARGAQADWYRNILADPHVELEIGPQHFKATAEPISDPCQIADILEVRYRRHPRLIGLILRADGVPVPPNRTALEAYASTLTMVAIRDKRPVD